MKKYPITLFDVMIWAAMFLLGIAITVAAFSQADKLEYECLADQARAWSFDRDHFKVMNDNIAKAEAGDEPET